MEDLRPTPDADPDEIRRTWRIFVDEGAVVELRALKTHQNIVSGYYTDPEAFVRDATLWSGKAAGVYFTLNPVKRSLFARAANRAKGWARATTSDQDITERRWFGIDFDARREAEISATDEEHAAALEKTRAARAWLTSLGWPASVLADSGNGGHAAYSLHLPHDEETTALLERCLKVLAARFDDEQVQVDQRTFNAARIWKLYGTAACKGDSVEDRPHRLACVLSVPDAIEDLAREQLEALAEMAPEDTPQERGHAQFSTGGRPFDLDDWIAAYAPDAVKKGPWGSGERWEFPVCPWNEAHTNGAAFLIRRVNGAIAAGCLHNGCKGKRWHDLRDAREPGWRERREAWEARRADLNGHSVLNSNLDNHSDPINSVNKVNSVRSISKWEMPLRFRTVDVPEFPTYALPGWLSDMVEATAEGTQTPGDLGGVFALSVLAAACAKKVQIRIRRGWIEPANLFTVISAPPASRKSAVFDALVAPLTAHEIEETDRLEATVAEAEAKVKLLEGRQKRALELHAKATGPDAEAAEAEVLELAREITRLKVPSRPRLVADDATQEKLATLLMEQEGRMAVLSPEGGVFDLLAGRYSAGGAPNIDVFLKGHAGDTIRVDRVGRPSEFVRRPALTVGLMVQPDVLRGLAEKPSFRGRGLLGRFLYSIPRSLIGHRNPFALPAPLSITERYYAELLALLALPLPEDGDGRLLELSGEATETLQAFEGWMEPQLAEDAELGTMTDWAGKLVGATARITGLLHLAANSTHPAPWSLEVAAETVERAICLGHYFIGHAQAAFSEMGADPVVEDAKQVMRWARKHGLTEFSRRDLWRHMLNRFRTADAMDPALNLLVSHHYLRPVYPERPAGQVGRVPSPRFEVNPNSNAPDRIDYIDKTEGVGMVSEVTLEHAEATDGDD